MALTVMPMHSGRARAGAVPEPRRAYYVLIPGMAEIGGHAVEERGGERIVRLTEAQAQYWLDQAVIGEQPGQRQLGGALGDAPRRRADQPRRQQPERGRLTPAAGEPEAG